MKRLFFLLFLVPLVLTRSTAQDFIADSIRSVIENPKSDSIKAAAMIDLTSHKYFDLNNHDTAVIVLNSARTFSHKQGLKDLEVQSIEFLSDYYSFSQDKSRDQNKGLQLNLQGLFLARKYHLKAREIDLLLDFSNKPEIKPDSVRLLTDQALSLSLEYGLADRQIDALTRKADFYASSRPDSAKFYFLEALAIARQSHLTKSEGVVLQTMANTYSAYHWGDSAKNIIQQALRLAKINNFANLEYQLLQDMTFANFNLFLRDSLNSYYGRMLFLCRQLHKDSLKVMSNFAQSSSDIGNYPTALQIELVLLHTYEARKDSLDIEKSLYQLGYMYALALDYHASNKYYFEALKIGKSPDFDKQTMTRFIALNYLALDQKDSTRYYAERTYQIALGLFHDPDKIEGWILDDLGMAYFGIGADSIALNFFRKSYFWWTHGHNDPSNYCETTIGLSNYFKKAGLPDSSFYFAKLCFNEAKKNGFLDYQSQSSGLISGYYHDIRHNSDSAYFYQKIGFEAYKTLYGEENSRQFQNMSFAEQQKKQDLAQAKKTAAEQYASNLRLYALITVLIIAFIVGLILYRNNLQKQRANTILQKAYANLKSTQSQLIQSEKMASLGELAAGIAHEIQNPLNFVNNFSEVNRELIEEVNHRLHRRWLS